MNAPAMRGALARFQHAFAHALVAKDVAAGETECAALYAQPGFSVYRNTVMKGCIDALQANFPSVSRLVGDEWFRAAAALYARENLPRHPTLLGYGEGFPAFLEGFGPAAKLPYLAGVARLDRYWTEAHIARDEDPVTAEAVARLGPEALARTVLSPHASARWAWFEAQPIATIWRRNRDADGEHDAPLTWRSEGVLIVRPHDTLESVELDAPGCAFLDACAAGGTLTNAALKGLGVDPQTDLSQLMARLLNAGAFGRLALLEETPDEETQ